MKETELKRYTEGFKATGARKEQEAPKWGESKGWRRQEPEFSAHCAPSP